MNKKKRTPFNFRTSRILKGSERNRTKSCISWVLACSSNNMKEIKSRLEESPELAYYQDEYTGLSCLHWMVKHDNKDLVQYLIQDLQVSPNMRNKSGQTPLHFAALYNRRELYNLLLATYAADPQIRDNSGRLASNYLDARLCELSAPRLSDLSAPSSGQLRNQLKNMNPWF